MPTEPIEIVMPQMGEAINEATISVWHKKVGDSIEEGETLLDISTAKIEVDIPAPRSGTIAQLLYEEGDTVAVDTVIALMVPPGVDIKDIDTGNGSTAKAKKAPPKIEDPIPAPAVTEDEEAAEEEPLPGKEPNHVEEAKRDREREREHLMKRRSSPLVRNMARQLGIDLALVEGTGRHGRITKRDLERYIAEESAEREASETESTSPSGRARRKPQKPPEGKLKLDTVVGPEHEPVLLPPEEVRVPIMRRQIADQMIRSVVNIPQAYTVHEVDFTQLERLRLRYKPIFEKQFEARLTPLVFVIRSAADALLACPYINASWGGDRIILHRNVNIGIAVAIHGGLVVPVLKCVETMSLAGIARGIIDLAKRARAGKLKPADMEGATFTITSPGQLGATLGIPIVNKPQGGILHVGAIQKVPAVVTGPDGEDSIAIRQRAMLTLGIDHRLIDGWEADKFMVHIKEKIQRADFGLPA